MSTVTKAGKLREPFGEIPYLTSPMGCSRMGGWASCTEAYMWDVAEFFLQLEAFLGVVWLHICFGKGSEDIRVGGLRNYAVNREGTKHIFAPRGMAEQSPARPWTKADAETPPTSRAKRRSRVAPRFLSLWTV